MKRGRGLWRRIRKRGRQGYVRLMRSPGAPREVASGIALGLFLAMLPVLQTPLAIGVAELLRRVFRVRISRVAALMGTWLTNPLTGAVLYGGAFFLGRPLARWLLPQEMLAAPDRALSLSFASAGPFAVEVLLSLLLGGILIGLPVAVGGYHLTLSLIARYQRRRVRRVRQRIPATELAVPRA